MMMMKNRITLVYALLLRRHFQIFWKIAVLYDCLSSAKSWRSQFTTPECIGIGFGGMDTRRGSDPRWR